jgi:hypothetical protein
MAAYQAIVDLIRASANAVNPTGFFVHGRRSDGSLEYNEAFPQIHLYPFTTNPQDTNSNILVANIVMAFWGQDSPESSNEEREAIIAAMDILSDNFLNNLDLSQLEIFSIRKEPQYRTLSATLSGYAITFNLRVFISPC